MVKLDWPFLIAAGVCTLVAGQIGSRLMVAKLKGPVIKRIFGVVLLGLGLKLLHGVLWG